jgi:hypothetical protein
MLFITQAMTPQLDFRGITEHPRGKHNPHFPPAIPEPSSVLLVVFAFFAFLLFRRK